MGIFEVFQSIVVLAEVDDSLEHVEAAAVEEAANEAMDVFAVRMNLAELSSFDGFVLLDDAATETIAVNLADDALNVADEAVVAELDSEAAAMLAPFELDLAAAAALCTELSRIEDPRDVALLLEELAKVLDVVGLVVWLWDSQLVELTPALLYGYSDEVLAQLPNLPLHVCNATAAAFRSAQACVVSGGEVASDALVVPLVTPAGCGGVLAIELQNGAAQNASVGAVATILAAQLARVVGVVQPVVVVANRRRV